MSGLANSCCCRGDEAARRGIWRWRELGTSSWRRGVMQRKQTRRRGKPGLQGREDDDSNAVGEQGRPWRGKHPAVSWRGQRANERGNQRKERKGTRAALN